jgi:hypothetical protein
MPSTELEERMLIYKAETSAIQCVLTKPQTKDQKIISRHNN